MLTDPTAANMLPKATTGRGAAAQIVYSGDEAAAEIRALIHAVGRDEDSYERWEALITRASDLEGGVTRNASPSAIELVRNVYDCFLSKFPLFFGYWKKYADLEFAIGGPETAEFVYERGVSAITSSVDLWTNYCAFKMEVCHDQDEIRVLFERAAYFVGLDFHSHPFWDKYLEFEDRAHQTSNIIKLCIRAANIPNYECVRYWNRFLQQMTHKPVEEWVEPSYLDAVKAEVDAENQVLPQTGLSQPQISPLEIERQLLAKINLAYHSRFTLTQKQVQERWQFEKNISRPYFHVTKLPPAEVDTWHKYLDFEQRQGDYDRIAFLFERCLVACALYDKFWLRYARWMFSQGKEENARLIYMRACTLFIPVQRPNVRLKWARFEEKLGRFTIARDIHLAILEHVPDATKVIISLGGLIRRQHGIDLAVQFLEDQILRGTKIAGTLVGEQVRVLWVCKNKPEEARQVFKDKAALLSGDSNFWAAWLRFEIDQPATFNTEEQATDMDEAHARVKAVYEQIPREQFAFKVFKFLTKLYMQFLLSRGGSKVAVEYMELDMWGNGYPTPMEE